jgi:hypothetical protein
MIDAEKLDIEDRKSDAHDVFRWIIVTFYREPVSKYYWENFCVNFIGELGTGIESRQRTRFQRTTG